jgi:hypothetical protein
VSANKSHHATPPEERYKVLPYPELYIDAGFGAAEEVLAAGIDVGTPVVYQPNAIALAGDRIAGTSVDDRAACAVIVEVARALAAIERKPTVHLVFSVQEEFNLRGAVTAAQALSPDIAIQLDLILATDTPDLANRGDVRLGGGPAMSLYSFHGRGTLNGTIPHPALVQLFADAAGRERLPLQRSAHIGALTDSLCPARGAGVAAIDLDPRHTLIPRWGLRSPRRLTRLPRPLPLIDQFSRPRRLHSRSTISASPAPSIEGVLIADDGAILATASKPHRLRVPRPAGPSTVRAKTGGTTSPSSAKKPSPTAKVKPTREAVGASARSCMLPVDADGAPLMNAISTVSGASCARSTS